MKRPRLRRLVHERRVQVLALAAGLPGRPDVDVHPLHRRLFGQSAVDARRSSSSADGSASPALFASAYASPLRTLANLLEAMREGDYSIRARGARFEDALGEVMQQVNAMGATLRAQRLGALEATTLLRKVMEEIDVAIFAFDHESRLKLINPRGRASGRACRPSVS